MDLRKDLCSFIPYLRVGSSNNEKKTFTFAIPFCYVFSFVFKLFIFCGLSQKEISYYPSDSNN